MEVSRVYRCLRFRWHMSSMNAVSKTDRPYCAIVLIVMNEKVFFAGVTEDQMIENGGRGASRLVLRVIGRYNNR